MKPTTRRWNGEIKHWWLTKLISKHLSHPLIFSPHSRAFRAFKNPTQLSFRIFSSAGPPLLLSAIHTMQLRHLKQRSGSKSNYQFQHLELLRLRTCSEPANTTRSNTRNIWKLILDILPELGLQMPIYLSTSLLLITATGFGLLMIVSNNNKDFPDMNDKLC